MATRTVARFLKALWLLLLQPAAGRVFKFGLMASNDDLALTASPFNSAPTMRAVVETWMHQVNSVGGLQMQGEENLTFELHQFPETNTGNRPCQDVETMLAMDTAWVEQTQVNAVFLMDCEVGDWSVPVNNSLTGGEVVNWENYLGLLLRPRVENFAKLSVTSFFTSRFIYDSAVLGNQGWNMDVDRTTKGKAMMREVAVNFERSVGYTPRIAFLYLNEDGWYAERVKERLSDLEQYEMREAVVYQSVLNSFENGCGNSVWDTDCGFSNATAGGSQEGCCDHTVIRRKLEEVRAAGANVLILYAWAEGRVISRMLKEMDFNLDAFYSINNVEGAEMEHVVTSKLWSEDERSKDPLFGSNQGMIEAYKQFSPDGNAPEDWTVRHLIHGTILTEAIKTLRSMPEKVFDFEALNNAIAENVIDETFMGRISFRGFRYNQAFECVELQVQSDGMLRPVLPVQRAAVPMVLPAPTFECRGGCACPPGLAENERKTKCVPCKPGFFQPGGEASCLACSPGSYALNDGSSSCDLCGKGAFSAMTGSDACELCDFGETTEAIGASSCAACGLGRYADERGAPECVACPSDLQTTAYTGALSRDDCVCTENHEDDGHGSCVACPLLSHSSTGGRCQTDTDTLVTLAVVVAVAVVFATTGAAVAWALLSRLRIWEKAARHDKLKDCVAQVSSWLFPMNYVEGDAFAEFQRMISFETARSRDVIGSYFSFQELADAISRGLVIVFFSHQWLGWFHPDPDCIQYVAILQAMNAITSKFACSQSDLRLWLDYHSVPQAAAAAPARALAISQLPLYASASTIFVVVAPNAVHSDSAKECDLFTYSKRLWCRAEIFSHYSRRGAGSMHVLSADGNELMAAEESWIAESMLIFEGECTCCERKHEGMPCDKPFMRDMMLGLYADVLWRSRKGDKLASEVETAMTNIKDRIFPMMYEIEVKGSARLPVQMSFSKSWAASTSSKSWSATTSTRKLVAFRHFLAELEQYADEGDVELFRRFVEQESQDTRKSMVVDPIGQVQQPMECPVDAEGQPLCSHDLDLEGQVKQPEEYPVDAQDEPVCSDDIDLEQAFVPLQLAETYRMCEVSLP